MQLLVGAETYSIVIHKHHIKSVKQVNPPANKHGL